MLFLEIGIDHLFGQVAKVQQLTEHIELEKQNRITLCSAPVFDVPGRTVSFPD